MSYKQAIMQIVETMEMNATSTNPDTLAPPELGSVEDLVIVPEAGDAVKGSTGLGAESTSPQHKASISLKDSHKSDPASTATLVVSSSNSIQVFVSPAPANGWKSSRPAVAPLGQMMHGFSTSGAQVDDVVVVATVVVSSAGAGMGAGVVASKVGSSVGAKVGVSVGVLVGAATLTLSAEVGAVVVGQHEIL